MRHVRIALLAVAVTTATAPEVRAWGADFTEHDLATWGKHCVHGYWVNSSTTMFYAGDTALLNRELPKYADWQYATRKVIVHVGTKRAHSPWDTKLRDTFADWSVMSYDAPADAAKATPRQHLLVEVWVGRQVRSEDLRIPKEFEVVPGLVTMKDVTVDAVDEAAGTVSVSYGKDKRTKLVNVPLAPGAQLVASHVRPGTATNQQLRWADVKQLPGKVVSVRVRVSEKGVSVASISEGND